MNPTPQHTPTPWHAWQPDGEDNPASKWGISAGKDYSVCTVHNHVNSDTGRTNAAFIVLACNSHDSLVKSMSSLNSRNIDLTADRDRLRESNAELLAALKPFAMAKTTVECPALGKDRIGMDSIITRARAAIAKAEGRA